MTGYAALNYYEDSMIKSRAIVLSIMALLILAGCASAPDSDETATVAEAPAVPAPVEPERDVEAPADGDGAHPAEDLRPADTPDPDEPDLPKEPEDPEGEPDQHTFEVTEEVFERTFSEVEQTIEELNAIIERRDYQQWLSYLTEEYRRTYSDPRMLREISRMPTLQRNQIELRSLRDYFEWVVGPSRANARLDDLRFLTDQQVEAIMVVRDQPVILYRLRNLDGNWKVDVF